MLHDHPTRTRPTIPGGALRRAPLEALTAPFARIVRHRRLLAQTTRSDIMARFAGSIMGPLWLVLFPAMFLGAYALVYLYIFKVRPELFSSTDYVVLIFCGLIPFLGFAEGLSTSTTSVTANASLIKNTLFPIELVPVKAILVSQATQVVGTGLLLVAIAATGKLTLWALLLPAIWVLQILFSIGVAWIFASLHVFVRDLQQVVSVLILLLMMVSPIAYSADMVPAGLRPWLGINPLYYVITCYQDALLLGRMPRDGTLWMLAAIALGTFVLGAWLFGRLKAAFADHV